MNSDKTNAIKEIAGSHVDYWHHKNLEGYQGGPFADRSGGLITFQADTEQQANAYDQDPFVVHGLLETKWVKKWGLSLDRGTHYLYPSDQWLSIH